jgi:hypothetical protein
MPAHEESLSSGGYKAIIAQLPPPTTQQVNSFLTRVCNSHSWYKHLAVSNGTPFVVFLSPTAGMRRHGGKWIDYTEDDGTRFHYTWCATAEYRRKFGYLDYTYGDEVSGRSIVIEDTSGQKHQLPPDVQAAGSAHLTAMCHGYALNYGLLTPVYDRFIGLYRTHLGLPGYDESKKEGDEADKDGQLPRKMARTDECPSVSSLGSQPLTATNKAASGMIDDASRITVRACLPSGQVVALERVHPDETVVTIKRKMEAQEGIMWWAQMLFLDMSQLETLTTGQAGGGTEEQEEPEESENEDQWKRECDQSNDETFSPENVPQQPRQGGGGGDGLDQGLDFWAANSRALKVDMRGISDTPEPEEPEDAGDAVSTGTELHNSTTIRTLLDTVAEVGRLAEVGGLPRTREQSDDEQKQLLGRDGLDLVVLVDDTAIERNLDWHKKCWEGAHYWHSRHRATEAEVAEPSPVMISVMKGMLRLEEFNHALATASGKGVPPQPKGGHRRHNAEEAEAALSEQTRQLKRQLLLDFGVLDAGTEGGPESLEELQTKDDFKRAFALPMCDGVPQMGPDALIYVQRKREHLALEEALYRAAGFARCKERAGSTSAAFERQFFSQ